MKIDKERDVIIDYLTVTYPLNTDLTSSLKFQHYELLDYICTFLNYEPCEVYKEPYAKNNFRHEFTLGGVAILRFDGPENKYHQATAMIELKGEACRDFERRNTDKKWIDLLIFLNSLNCNYKRIDLTIDDYKGDIVTQEWIYKKYKAGLCVYQSRIVKLFGELSTGLTLQFGSRTSSRMLVIYDKKKEKEKDKITVPYDYWVRYEMRFSDEMAGRLAYLMISDYDDEQGDSMYGSKIQSLANQLLYSMLDIKENNNLNEHNKSKAPTDKKWLKFLDEVDKITLAKTPDEEHYTPSYISYFRYMEPKVAKYLLILYLTSFKNDKIFEMEIYKLLRRYINFNKKQFYQINIYLKQLGLQVIDDADLKHLESEFEDKIEEKELPF